MTGKTQENTFSITPGQLLSAARESRGLSQIDISKQTRLPLQIVSDIERDEYKRIGARTFARGYLCCFARLVGVPEKKVLESFDASGLMPAVPYTVLPSIEGAPVLNVTRQQRLKFRSLARRRSTRRVMMITAGAFLVVMGIAWLQSQKNAPLKSIVSNGSTTSIALAQQPVADATMDASSAPVIASHQPAKKKTAAAANTKVATKKKLQANATKNNSENNGFVIRPQANNLPTTYTITPVS